MRTYSVVILSTDGVNPYQRAGHTKIYTKNSLITGANTYFEDTLKNRRQYYHIYFVFWKTITKTIATFF